MLRLIKVRRVSCFAALFLLISIVAIGAREVHGIPPTVVTLAAQNVTATSALLRGTVNPNGLATIWDFPNPPNTIIYCPSGAGNLPAGAVAVLVSCTATGLTPSTTYQYVMRASNADGFVQGSAVSFTTLPATVTTDWAVMSVTLTPSAPRVGDSVAFRMIMTAASTTGSFPQTVGVQCQIDGGSCGAGTVTYPGPSGVSFTVTTSTPWTATLGGHTLAWAISTANDPNPGNNFMSTNFNVQPAEAEFDFAMSVSPSERTATPGGSASYSITVSLASGSAQNVALSLSGEPSGVSGSFSPSSGNPPFSSTLTLTASSSISPGSYSMTITGTGGGRTKTATVTLIISQAPDFRIEASPPSQTASQGQAVSYSVNVVGLNGFNSQVTLSVSGLPTGANGVFSSPSSTPNFSSTLTVTLPNNVQTGSYTLTITGSGGGLTKTANVVLLITAAPQTQTTQTGGGVAPSGLLEMLQQNIILLVGVLGLIIVLLIVGLAIRRRGPAYPQPPPPPPPPTKACPKCGQPLMYVPQYDRWYCNNCKEYR